MGGEVSAELRIFILDHISSVVQLEALLFLRRSGREWTAADVAQELRIDHKAAAEQLAELAVRGLVEQLENPTRFRYDARRPEMDERVVELQRAYEDRRVSIIGLIYSTSGPKVQEFARAFRLRKDDDG